MKRATLLLSGLLLVAALDAQQPPPLPEDTHPSRPFPGGKDMRDELLKAEHQKSIKDAEQLMKLSQELKEELEKNTRFILSISAMKKTEEIEKIAKRIRGRMQR